MIKMFSRHSEILLFHFESVFKTILKPYSNRFKNAFNTILNHVDYAIITKLSLVIITFLKT